MWEARNKSLHNGAPLGAEIATSDSTATITALYAMKDKFSRNDHVLFDLPLLGKKAPGFQEISETLDKTCPALLQRNAEMVHKR